MPLFLYIQLLNNIYISLLKDKSSTLFFILGAFFIANAILAEFLGVKIFSLEETFGFNPVNLSLFGFDNLSFNLTTGVLLWPVVFIMTDIINEYFGRKGVRFMSFTAAALIALNMDLAFNTIFGQGLWIIIGSLVAFLIGQIVDVTVFHYLRSFTGSSKIWLRATGSTLVSQFIDSFVVLFIAFYIGAGWDLKLVLAIGVVNYIYKFFIAVILTPLLYILHYFIDLFLGKYLANKLIQEAAKSSGSH
jgi:uncharacterized integral membrane protein (TIGR00697 family)